MGLPGGEAGSTLTGEATQGWQDLGFGMTRPELPFRGCGVFGASASPLCKTGGIRMNPGAWKRQASLEAAQYPVFQKRKARRKELTGFRAVTPPAALSGASAGRFPQAPRHAEFLGLCTCWSFCRSCCPSCAPRCSLGLLLGFPPPPFGSRFRVPSPGRPFLSARSVTLGLFPPFVSFSP